MAGAFNTDDIRNTVFRLTDPYDQRDLITHIPNGAKLIDVLNIYEFDRFPTEKAFCVVCQGRRHKRGFTAALTTGNRVLLGSRCGHKKFGATWQDAEKRLKVRSDHQFELVMYDRLTMIRPQLDPMLRRWQHVFEHVEARKAAFSKLFGELSSRLLETARRGDTRLTIHREVKASAFQQAQARDDEKPKVTYQEFVVGTLAGPLFFDPLDTHKATLKAIEAVDTHSFEKASHREMTKRRKAVEKAFEDLRRCVDIYRDVDAFLSPSNFAGLARWADQNPAIRRELVARSDGLFYADDLSKGLTLSVPLPDLDESLIDLIWEYRRAS